MEVLKQVEGQIALYFATNVMEGVASFSIWEAHKFYMRGILWGPDVGGNGLLT